MPRGTFPAGEVDDRREAEWAMPSATEPKAGPKKPLFENR